MANLIVALITLAAVIAAAVTLSQGALAPQGSLSDAWKTTRTLTGEMVRTEMSSLGVVLTGGGSEMELTVLNNGQEPLRSFKDWDLILSYEPSATGTDLAIVRFTYTESASPSAGQWTVKGIYLNASESSAEVFDPGIVDPGEEFVVLANVGVAIASPSNNAVKLAAANGVTLSAQFTN